MCETAMMAIDQKVVFLCGDRVFTLGDLLDAALFRGELQSAWNNLLRLLAAEQRADEHQLECSDETIDAAAERFRYEHDLITAEETEQWLSDRGLSLGDFGAFFVRHYWGEQSDDLEPEARDYLTAPNELRELLVAELILSREIGRMAERFSWRVAAAREVDGKQVDPDLIAAEKTRFFERTSVPVEMLLDWLTKAGRDESWFCEMLTLEAIFCRDTAALLSPQAREKEMASLRLPLTRFEIETIELDSLDAAREAFLCARDDGLAMEEVAAEGRYPFQRTGGPAGENPGKFATAVSQRSSRRYPGTDRPRRHLSRLPHRRQDRARAVGSERKGTSRTTNPRSPSGRPHDTAHSVEALLPNK